MQYFILLHYFSHLAGGICPLSRRCVAWEALKEASMFPFHKLFNTGRLVEIQQRHQDSAKTDLHPKVSEETCAVYRGKATTSVLTKVDQTTSSVKLQPLVAQRQNWQWDVTILNLTFNFCIEKREYCPIESYIYTTGRKAGGIWLLSLQFFLEWEGVNRREHRLSKHGNRSALNPIKKSISFSSQY